MVNERIRELWAKCVIKHTKDPMNWQTVADEFAELIVRECANACLDEGVKFQGEQDISDFKLCAHVIKDHFGVEE